MKKVFYTELAYLFGILALAFGAAAMELADFGMSMVVAPAYLLHLKLSVLYPFFSFGMAEYTLQAVLILVLSLLMKKCKAAYLFSFVTAVFYGFVLDGFIALLSLLPESTLLLRIVWYAVGLVACSTGVSLLFHSYIPPEAYEVFVKEISRVSKRDIHFCKTVYDCASCALSVILSFSFFGLWHFEGVKWGTVICALVNGFLIGRFTRLFESKFAFGDALSLRRFFE